MSDQETAQRFEPYDRIDGALPGDPWSHVRYHYGQLLGAEDFSAEQRAFILRHRLHLALFHGAGTVWGLRVLSDGENNLAEASLKVTPGLAVDVIGREIYVNETQCLDIKYLHQNQDFWSSLEPSDGDARRAYVVLRYEACLSESVPAITPPCSDADEALAYGRINDRFRIDLFADPPPDPHDLQREWLTREGATSRTGEWKTPRDRLLAHLLNAQGDPGDLSSFWQRLEEQNFPLLLAAVDLKLIGDQVSPTVHNEVRPLLPPVQLVAEQLLGQRLMGADGCEPLKVVDHSVSLHNGLTNIVIDLTDAPAEDTVKPASVKVLRLENTGWVDFQVRQDDIEVDGTKITVSLKAWEESTTYQIHLNGAGVRPIATVDGRPLSGWWDEPVLAKGRGLDVSVVDNWTPDP